MCKFLLYLTSLKLGSNGKKDKVKPSLYPQINSVWLKYSSSIIMIQAIIEKGSLSFQWGEDGIQLDFSAAFSFLRIHRLQCHRRISMPPVIHCIRSQVHYLGVLYGIKLVGRTEGEAGSYYTKLEGKSVVNMRPCSSQIQTRCLKFRVLRTTNACIEFQYLRHHTERLSYMKIHQICHRDCVTNDWN